MCSMHVSNKENPVIQVSVFWYCHGRSWWSPSDQSFNLEAVDTLVICYSPRIKPLFICPTLQWSSPHLFKRKETLSVLLSFLFVVPIKDISLHLQVSNNRAGFSLWYFEHKWLFPLHSQYEILYYQQTSVSVFDSNIMGFSWFISTYHYEILKLREAFHPWHWMTKTVYY